ncbi:MAG: hypothetical protein LBK66_04630 [Spirochaetaceae bacterium]|jgi:hypothetical protein|nr:hypothetical protein [Spirochaetaceae bacterium]
MYTPQLSDFSVISLRRLAWAMGTPMGAAVNRIVRLLPAMVDPALVCQRCKDKSKCPACVFSTAVSESEKTALTAI